MIRNFAIQVLVATLAYAAVFSCAEGAVVSSAPFSFGFGYTGANGGSWNSSETSPTNTPTTQGSFTFSPVPVGDRFSSDGVTFVNRILTDATGGNGFSGYVTSSFRVPITASYNGNSPADASAVPDYKLRIEISRISIYGGRHNSSTSGSTLQWDEITPGHASSSPAITLTTSNNFNVASTYKQLVWDPADFDLSIASVNSPAVRTFTIPVSGGSGDLRYLDGIQVDGTVSMIYDATPQTGAFRWQTVGLGNWSTGSNWDRLGVPNSNSVDVIFGGEVTATTTIATNSAVTARSIQFDNSNTFVIGGAGSITLSSDSGHAELDVLQGMHQFQAALNLASNTDVNVSSGASIAINNGLNLGGNSLNKVGSGTLEINNDLNTGNGAVNAQAGVLSGVGLISRDLNNTGAEVAPGNSAGKLSVGGNYTQSANGLLKIEIGGTTVGSQYDQLAISGQAAPDGALDVDLTDAGNGPFSPALNDSFIILTATGGRTGMFALQSTSLPALSAGLRWEINYDANDVVLSVTAAGVPGDYDNNGVVDAADYVIWRKNPLSLLNEGASPGVVDQADYDFWRANFGNIVVASVGALVSVPEPDAIPPMMLMGPLVLVFGRNIFNRIRSSHFSQHGRITTW